MLKNCPKELWHLVITVYSSSTIIWIPHSIKDIIILTTNIGFTRHFFRQLSEIYLKHLVRIIIKFAFLGFWKSTWFQSLKRQNFIFQLCLLDVSMLKVTEDLTKVGINSSRFVISVETDHRWGRWAEHERFLVSSQPLSLSWCSFTHNSNTESAIPIFLWWHFQKRKFPR